MPESTRVIAQDILTKRFLHWDIRVSDLTVQWNLSGPTAISGNFPAELRDIRDIGLEPWATWIHVEEDGVIRASGILQPAQIDADETLTLDAAGPSAYAKGIPYLGKFLLSGTDSASGETGVGLGLDPADIVRAIWAELQSYPASNLGVTVVGETDAQVGTPKKEVSFTASADGATTGTTTTDTTTSQVDFTAGPYSALDWWEHKDCQSEIESLAKETPFDFVERCAWNAAKTDVIHWIELGYPRIGTTPTGVRFAQEENIIAAIGPEEPDDRYASHVVVLGKGEGTARIRGEASRPLRNRLRRVVVVEDKTIDSIQAANAIALDELNRRQALADVTEVTVHARHPNASLGSYDVGDDVPVAADIPWLGYLQLKQRVLSIVYTPASESVKLALRSSSTF
ncbi:hypothetical protein EV383_4376 [Pseudonocardia sediminis]|uniref:Phage protein D n=1 Tax=Pseudonocardia sediminis TaxID=1397368 RepID=A0A4Q7UZ96_PSEST|nr:hypothetical protein [Pseudonocardia sediminis]RZT87452.1 hypothetical protein EV383_4376 [Pseudonocardia sediminis]